MKNVFDLTNKKSVKEAFLFYIITVIICGVLAGVLSAIIATIFYPDAKTFEEGRRIGMFYGPRIAMIYCFAFALFAVIKKSLGTTILPLLLVIISPVLGFVFGGFGGMIPATIITTIENKNLSSKNDEKNTQEDVNPNKID